MSNIRIAITCGEPAGIGPDLLIALAQQTLPGIELVAVADPDLLESRAQLLDLSLGDITIEPAPLGAPCQPGQLNPDNARYVLSTLDTAITGCLEGRYQAMVTAPVQKSVINDAGIPFTGHTEYLAEKTNTEQVVMMLATESMRVALVTTHLPLLAVPAAITPERLDSIYRITAADLRNKFGISQPRIAVLGLNPHAGEEGHLGREEIEVIIPVLEKLRSERHDALGPLPADTAFNAKVLDQCDAVLAMYHDQGLPVLKYSGFGSAANITLGLPLVRTSVDHGTALDLAGTGQADSGSLLYAIKVAADMARNQHS